MSDTAHFDQVMSIKRLISAQLEPEKLWIDALPSFTHAHVSQG